MPRHTEQERFGTRPQVSPGLTGTTAAAKSFGGGEGAIAALLQGILVKAQQQQLNEQLQFQRQQSFVTRESQDRQRLFQEAQQRLDVPIPVQAPPGATLARRTPAGGLQAIETTPGGVSFQEGKLSPQKQLAAGRAQAGEQRAQQKERREQFKFEREERKFTATQDNAVSDLVSLVNAFEGLGFFKGPGLGQLRGAVSFLSAGTIGSRASERFNTVAKPLKFSLVQFATGQTGRALSDKDLEFVEDAFDFNKNQAGNKIKGKIQGAIDLLNNRIRSGAKDGQLLPSVDTIFSAVRAGINPITGQPLEGEVGRQRQQVQGSSGKTKSGNTFRFV